MHRQSVIFASLVIIVAVVIVATGYVTGAGPLGVLSNSISRLTSGGGMIPSRTLTEESKSADGAGDFERSLDQFRTAHVEELAWTRGVDRVLDVRVLQLSEHRAHRKEVGRAIS